MLNFIDVDYAMMNEQTQTTTSNNIDQFSSYMTTDYLYNSTPHSSPSQFIDSVSRQVELYRRVNSNNDSWLIGTDLGELPRNRIGLLVGRRLSWM